MTTITETAARPSWVRPDDVCKMLSVSPRTLKRYVADGIFPAPIKLTSKTNVWFEHEVIEWMTRQANMFRRAA